jgi:hypothetical protein
LEIQQLETEKAPDAKELRERRYLKVFTAEAFDKLPDQRKWDHQITLVEGTSP